MEIRIGRWYAHCLLEDLLGATPEPTRDGIDLLEIRRDGDGVAIRILKRDNPDERAAPTAAATAPEQKVGGRPTVENQE
jgi:hypothetical protein